MGFSDNCPKAGDTTNVLLQKIAGSACSFIKNIPKELIVSFEGDSIAQQTLPTWPDFLSDYSSYFVAGNRVINYGAPGDRASGMVGEYVTESHLNRPLRDIDDAWFMLHGGGNDILDGDSAATIYENLKLLWSAARADGYVVVAITILPRSNFDADVAMAAIATELNQLILSDPGLYTYAVQADVLFQGHVLDTTYLYDGIHPTVFGARLIAQAVVNVLGVF